MRKNLQKELETNQNLEFIRQATNAEDIYPFLDDEAFFIRSNALRQLALRFSAQKEVLQRIEAEILKERSSEPRYLGTVNQSYVGIASLLESGHRQAIKSAEKIIANWDKADFPQLERFLQTSGLLKTSETTQLQTV